MILNLFLIAFRNLKKNKFFSLLNILGLSVGMAVFFLIAQYVRYERRLDTGYWMLDTGYWTLATARAEREVTRYWMSSLRGQSLTQLVL